MLVNLQEVAIAYAEFSVIFPKEIRVVQSSPCRRRDPTLTPIHCCLQVGVRKQQCQELYAVSSDICRWHCVTRQQYITVQRTQHAALRAACGGAATEWFTQRQTRPHSTQHAVRSTQYAVRSTQYAVRSAEAQRRSGLQSDKHDHAQHAARSTQYAARRPSDGVDYTVASKERGAQSTQCGGPATEWITKRQTLTTQHAPSAEAQRRSGLHSGK
jgi:hypothetical protein